MKESESFSIKKLSLSLQHSGASKEEIETIILKIKPDIYNGISFNEIYEIA